MTNLKEGPISWMARNPVAANLLMIVLIAGGFLMALQIKQEVFPEFTLDLIEVSVPYPGASPEEVEKGILLAIEDEVRGIDNIKKVTSQAREGGGDVTIELLLGANSSKALQDVKNAVDRIRTLPEESERPTVSMVEARKQVVSLILYGEYDRSTLRQIGEKARDDLLQYEKITLVNLSAVPNIEIGVEVPQRNLRSYNLTLGQIADVIRRTSIELPGGGVKTASGEVLLRTQERRDYASEFEDIPIVVKKDGTTVSLQEIASINETFEETNQEAFFNGFPAIRVDIFRTGIQTPIEISNQVKDYAKILREDLPKGVQISVWGDSSEIYRDRINLLAKNAFLGLILVLLLLGLFLEPKLAFWVTLGIPISIIGSFLFIPLYGASINMVSLFAFIITLGIIVDDAVVVGEIIYQKREKGVPFLQAAIEGAREIAGPVTFAVLTNVAAFMPLFFIPGVMGKIFIQIPAIVVSVFLISLIESIFVLPAHLTHPKSDSLFWRTLTYPSLFFEKLLKNFIRVIYARVLKFILRHRYLTVTFGVSILIVALGVIGGGIIQFSFLPRVDNDLVSSQVVMPFGIPIETSRKVQKQMVNAAKKAIEDQGGDISRGIYTQIGTVLKEGGPPTDQQRGGPGGHLIGVQVFLVPTDQRKISGVEFANAWREATGDITGLQSIVFNATIGSTGGKPIDIELSHANVETIESAAVELAEDLKGYVGVTDINSGVSLGKPQYNFKITPEARSLGITAQDLANQVRWSFYGAEALRQQRGRNEIKVMVRLPEQERKRLSTVEELILRTDSGGEIPLAVAADITEQRAYTMIRRSEGRRVISVTADVDENIANANEIIGNIIKTDLPILLNRYSGLSYTLEGQQREQSESLETMAYGFIFALIAIYGLLAIPFKSYVQPLIVMTSIPFGIIGAIIGHLLLGYELSIISILGIVALSGVVVNDSLVLIVSTNRFRADGSTPYEAITQSAPLRFRPILLTSLTTFFGLAPMIFETSLQARFLIPMAISLGFGILFATGIILLIVPSIYLIVEDLRKDNS